MTYGVVYLVTNKHTGEQYVGQTRQKFLRRWAAHINTAKSKVVAVQLIQRDKRIVQIEGVLDAGEANNPRLNLVCRFEPEPDCNSTGFFWIAFLMTRIEFEIDPRGGELNWPFDIGFSIGEDIFLPNGKMLKAPPNYITLWPPNHE